MDNNKWNPADIWLFSPEVVDEEWSANVAVLNGQIADYYEDGKLVGISLKKISKNNDAIEKLYNDPNIEADTYNYEGYKSTSKAAGASIIFTGGEAAVRLAGGISGFAVEIKGKASQGGKAGKEAIDIILKNNGLIPLQPYNDVLEGFNINNEEYKDKLYYLFDRFIENISKEDFEDKYNGSELKWKVGNYYSLELIERLEDNKPEPANEIVSDIIRYAYSSTKDSSKFIKIS